MSIEVFSRDRYTDGAYVEDALRRFEGIFKALRLSAVVTPMSVHGYVPRSELCQTIAAHMAPSLANGEPAAPHAFAYLRGLDAAYKVADEVHVLGDVSFALRPVYGPDGAKLAAFSEPSGHNIERLTNASLEYYFSSDRAKAIGAQAAALLAENENIKNTVTIAFAAGLMLADYGVMETLHDATQSPDEARQTSGAAALIRTHLPDGETFIG